MDPFEEFEFKPLTEGLGFHKKKTTPVKPEPALNETFSSKSYIKDQGLELIEEGSTDPLRPPLPRKNRATSALPTAPGSLSDTGSEGSSTAAVDEILKTLQKNRALDMAATNTRQKITASTKEEFKPTTWNFSSSLLDAMLVIASSLLCMIILLVISKVDLVANLTHPDENGMIYIATAALFAGVAFIYLTVNRVFLGYTPGEWAFDQRIGRPEQMAKASYSFKVIYRSLLVICTGFILFPLLSLVFGKDFAGAISGVSLYKKV